MNKSHYFYITLLSIITISLHAGSETTNASSIKQAAAQAHLRIIPPPPPPAPLPLGSGSGSGGAASMEVRSITSGTGSGGGAYPVSPIARPPYPSLPLTASLWGSSDTSSLPYSTPIRMIPLGGGFGAGAIPRPVPQIAVKRGSTYPSAMAGDSKYPQ